MKVESYFVKFRLFLFVVSTLIQFGCSDYHIQEANKKTESDILPVNKERRMSEKKISKNKNEVNLNLVEIKKGEIVFAITNKMLSSIYLSYKPLNDKSPYSFVTHTLECKEKIKQKFEIYGSDFHFVPSLAPILSEEKILFKVTSLPPQKSICKISIKYFDKEEDLERVNTAIGKSELSAEELEYLLSLAKTVSLEFETI